MTDTPQKQTRSARRARRSRGRSWRLPTVALRTGLALGSAVVVLLLGASALVAMQSLSRTSDAGSVVVTQRFPYVTELEVVLQAITSAGNHERGFLLSGSSEYSTQAIGTFPVIDSHLEAARELDSGSGEKIDEIRGAVISWERALKAEIALFEVDADAAKELGLGPNRDLSRRAERLVKSEIERASEQIDESAMRFSDEASRARTTVIVGLIFSVIAAIISTSLVIRTVRRRIRRILDSLRHVAAGDFTTSVEVDTHDELGEIAETLNETVGRTGATIATMSRSADQLSVAAQGLSALSEQMTAALEESARQAASVSTTAAQVSASAESAASGAVEMGASIREIAASAQDGASIAASAVEVTRDASARMAALTESSSRIGDIVRLITSIAEQTNLLALNATIEAARAGDAGRGFAVVANEVKELANETAKATLEIGSRISTIQTDADEALTAMTQIQFIIAQVNDRQTTIASAVEEQSVTTNEISQSVTQAAGGSSDIAATVAGLATATAEVSRGASSTRTHAEDLARMAEELTQIVGTFTYRDDTAELEPAVTQ
jgi:methyl-accepting chemotaxis protein